MERLRNAGGLYDGPSGCLEGGGSLNVMPWEYIEVRHDVVDRPVVCAFAGDTEQKVKPATCWLPHPSTLPLMTISRK